MSFYHPNQRKVYGTKQITADEEILTTAEYALRHSYTAGYIAKLCRKKKLKAYKSHGEWYIVAKKPVS